jgi:hypothetical protein
MALEASFAEPLCVLKARLTGFLSMWHRVYVFAHGDEKLENHWHYVADEVSSAGARVLAAFWVLLWGDCFVLASRLMGLARTARLIKALAWLLPTRKTDLGRVARRLSRADKRFGPAFLAGNRPCLIRGLVLYFYGKRMRRPVRLVVGGRRQEGTDSLLWHCWVVEDEADESDGYVPFFHFA